MSDIQNWLKSFRAYRVNLINIDYFRIAFILYPVLFHFSLARISVDAAAWQFKSDIGGNQLRYSLWRRKQFPATIALRIDLVHVLYRWHSSFTIDWRESSTTVDRIGVEFNPDHKRCYDVKICVEHSKNYTHREGREREGAEDEAREQEEGLLRYWWIWRPRLTRQFWQNRVWRSWGVDQGGYRFDEWRRVTRRSNEVRMNVADFQIKCG